MVIALRLLGLTMHLSSTALIWSISGYLQRLTGSISPEQRIRATLAFAWNPLLLYEACVNAHVDATLLFLILLAIWFLVSRRTSTIQSYLLAAATLAVATCVKINIVLLVPGLLLFLYLRRPFNVRPVLAAAATYVGTIILLYVPFWRGKDTLDVILVNPNSSLDKNSVADFFSHLYNSITHITSTHGPSEGVTHIIGMASFAFVYLILCWRAIRAPKRINTIPGLIRWMALVWLLYCAIGSPWYWPWYLVTFFGLFALVEATHTRKEWSFSFLRLPLATRLLAFSMLSLYCFYTWGPLDMDFTTTSIPPAIQVKDIACYPTSIIRAAFSAKARSRSLTQLIHTAYIQVSWVSLPVPKDLKQFLFRFRKHRLFGQITQHHNC